MTSTLHIVRGDSAANAVQASGVKRESILVCQDSLSWGPCGNDEDLREQFWASLDLPMPSDRVNLERVLEEQRPAQIVIWPEGFLDGLLHGAWAVSSIGGASRAAIHMPSSLTLHAFYFEQGDASPDSQPVPEDQLHALREIWDLHLNGKIESAIHGGSFSSIVGVGSIADCIRPRQPRGDQLPEFAVALLNPLLTHAADSMSCAALVGGYMSKTSSSPAYIDADLVLFSLLREFATHFKLLELQCDDPARYPSRCNVRLTSLGRSVLLGEESIAIDDSAVLRWWGGKDLAKH